MAQATRYDALMVDLRWGDGMDTEGYKVLDRVRNYAPIRILWTSDEGKDTKALGFYWGATHCISKGIPPDKLEAILKDTSRA